MGYVYIPCLLKAFEYFHFCAPLMMLFLSFCSLTASVLINLHYTEKRANDSRIHLVCSTKENVDVFLKNFHFGVNHYQGHLGSLIIIKINCKLFL